VNDSAIKKLSWKRIKHIMEKDKTYVKNILDPESSEDDHSSDVDSSLF
jgi:hypothetical protein